MLGYVGQIQYINVRIYGQIQNINVRIYRANILILDYIG